MVRMRKENKMTVSFEAWATEWMVVPLTDVGERLEEEEIWKEWEDQGSVMTHRIFDDT